MAFGNATNDRVDGIVERLRFVVGHGLSLRDAMIGLQIVPFNPICNNICIYLYGDNVIFIPFYDKKVYVLAILVFCSTGSYRLIFSVQQKYKKE